MPLGTHEDVAEGGSGMYWGNFLTNRVRFDVSMPMCREMKLSLVEGALDGCSSNMSACLTTFTGEVVLGMLLRTCEGTDRNEHDDEENFR